MNFWGALHLRSAGVFDYALFSFFSIYLDQASCIRVESNLNSRFLIEKRRSQIFDSTELCDRKFSVKPLLFPLR